MNQQYSGLSPEMRERVIEMRSSAEIPLRWQNTPIEKFVQAQNFGYPLVPADKPQVLISTCIEFRYALPIPAQYAYVIRTAGGRLEGQEFAVGYVLTKGVRNILLIAHDDCGMTTVRQKIPHLVDAFVEQGWSREEAQKYVEHHVGVSGIDDELDSLESEYHRLKQLFPKVHVAPLFLTLLDKKVHLPKWYRNFIESMKTDS
jgi:hypothetical protein